MREFQRVRDEHTRIAIIGFGRIAREDHLPAVVASETAILDSICDPDVGALERLPIDLDAATYENLDDLLAEREIDAAIVAVPHDQYVPVLERLCAKGIHILKEKPLAVDIAEAMRIDQIVKESSSQLMITLHRRYNPIFRSFVQMRQYVGTPFRFDYRYTLNVESLDAGWRSHANQAGGGALLDMGYHAIDLIQWYFGIPESVRAVMQYGSRTGQRYDVEDTCTLELRYGSRNRGGHPLLGNVLVSRVFPKHEEQLSLVGSHGMVSVDRHAIRRLDGSGAVVEELTRAGEWPSAHLDQLNTFIDWIRSGPGQPAISYQTHFQHISLIEAAYESARRDEAVDPKTLLTSRGVAL